MDEETFRRAMEEGEIFLECQLCGAEMWVAHAGGQPHLMRAGEIHHDDCPICSKIHELVS